MFISGHFLVLGMWWWWCQVQPSHKEHAIGAVHCKGGDVVATSPVA